LCLLDIRQLSLHIDELQYHRITGDISEIPQGNDDSDAKRVKLNRLGQYLSLWASRRRKISNLAIVDDDGIVAGSASESALVLENYWKPCFKEQGVSLALARLALKDHISRVDDDIDYVVPYDGFCERISKLRDSGVGCDSLLYGCWIHCHEEARVALYSLYIHLLDNELEGDEVEFLTSRFVFIQKGKIDADQAGNCRRHARKTRPLRLANTDCKIVSCMISIILAVVCTSCISTLQSGGMKGKQMIDLIFSLEAKIIDYIVRNVPNSGIFALDIASAFPSLSRKYLFWVLKQLGLPKRFRRLIRSLHRSSKGIICFKNLLFGILEIATGVGQGDPSAMQLFILAYDPLIRFIDRSLFPFDRIILPFCDDLALAVSDVCASWRIVTRCFVVIEKISSLRMNNEKTQFLLTSSSTMNEDILRIKSIDSQIGDSQFLAAIKYLGVLLGSECVDCNWEQVISDYISTSRFIASLDCGLLTKISLYNMIAITKLSYVASFFPPNIAALRAEKRALQLLCRGPWNAIPPNLLKSVKSIGIPAQATDLLTLSIASRVRVAQVTSQSIFVRNREVDALFNGFDIVLKYLDYKLCNSTCIKSICHAYTSFVNGNPLEVGESITQRTIYNKVASQNAPFSFGSFVSIKARRILGSIPNEWQTTCVVSRYRFASLKSAALTFTHIRTISNHWCTRSRFGAKNRGCLFSCGHETDAIKHTCICGSFWETFFRVAHIPSFPVNLKKVILFSGASSPISDREFRALIIGLHICFLCFNACRHGQRLSDRLVQHHLSHFMRRHHFTATMLRGIQCNT